jgi:ferredoxin-NADP reductase
MKTSITRKQRASLKQLQVIDVLQHSQEIFEIKLERGDIHFIPGQYISIYTPDHKISREYSIASGIHDPHLGFLVKHLPEGIVTEFLMNLKPGNPVTISKPAGSFRPGTQHVGENFIFIATGTGIAPFLSYVKSYPDNPPKKFFYGVKYRTDAVGYEIFNEKCTGYLAVSREKIPGIFHGRISDVVKKFQFEKNLHFYLCGLDSMIEEMRTYLTSIGIATGQIHHEIFFYTK